MNIPFIDFLSIFITMMGFIIGLGAVTVIDIHGFLGRTSKYWTEATTRTHKITKPMIWIGITLIFLGLTLLHRYDITQAVYLIHLLLIILLILNGIFLSFKVSPYMLEREQKGKSDQILPKEWQNKIAISLVLSDIGWWISLLLFVFYLIYGNL